MTLTHYDKERYEIPTEEELQLRIQRLEKLAAQINEHKDRFNYGYIFSLKNESNAGPFQYIINDTDRLYSSAEQMFVDDDIPITTKALNLINNCGTQCCVAGFTCIQRLEAADNPLNVLTAIEEEEFMGASKYLFLNSEESMFLFCPSRREKDHIADTLSTISRLMPLTLQSLPMKHIQYRLFTMSRLLYYPFLGTIDFQNDTHDYDEARRRVEYIVEYTRSLLYHPIRKTILE